MFQEDFASEARFAGVCDYFCVGGNWSGRLELLRIRNEQPKAFLAFWRKFDKVESLAEARKLFQKCFPKRKTRLPVARVKVPFEACMTTPN